MAAEPGQQANDLIEALLACAEAELTGWIENHKGLLGLPLLVNLRTQYVVPHVISNPPLAEKASRYALRLAENLTDEPLAFPIACWARGNWAQYQAPDEAVDLFQEALAGYRSAGNEIAVASLLTNLVAVLTECGRFAEAQSAYEEVLPIFTKVADTHPHYLLILLQNYGVLLHSQGRFEEALQTHKQAHDLARQSENQVTAAEIQVNIAFVLGMMGRLAEGEDSLLHEREVAAAHDQMLTVARIDMNLGHLYTAQGRPSAALRRLQMAREIFAAQDNDMEEGSVRLHEAALFRHIGAWQQARRSYRQARPVFERHQMWPQVGRVLVYYAAACRLSGVLSQAAHLLDEAEKLWREMEQPLWQMAVRFERVELALAQANYQQAVTMLGAHLPEKDNAVLTAHRDLLLAKVYQHMANQDKAQQAFERVLAYAVAHGQRWWQRQALAGLGQIHIRDDPENGRIYLERAIHLDDQTRQSLTVEEFKASFHTQVNDLLPMLIQLEITRKRPFPALAYTWKAKGIALLELLSHSRLKQVPSSQEHSQLETIRQALAVRRWQAAMTAEDDLPDSAREVADEKIQALEEQLYHLRQRRNQRHNEIEIERLNRPLELLAGMDAGLLLEYVRCDDRILGFCANRQGECQAMWLTDTAVLLDLLDELHLAFQNVVSHSPGQRRQYADLWLAECQPLLQTCHELLVAPFGRQLADQKVLIAPCEPLYLLPFAAFWDGAQYLTEQCQIEFITTGGLLAAPPAEGVARGKPVVIGTTVAGALPAVGDEAAVIASALPDCISFVDTPAWQTYLRHLSQPPRLLHLAAHSIIRHDAPIFSALQLSEGALSVEQCYELPLAGTELVTLSGCTTSSGLDTGGTLLAFQTAFLVAGAKRVVSSLWPVDDEATAGWMKLFYPFFAAGLEPAAALRKTQQHLIATPDNSHPAIWAAFVCGRR